jgi:NADH-quinone oxidoreductase subunit N
MFPTLARLEMLQSTVGTDAILFAPELVVCGGIVVLLLARLITQFEHTHLGAVVIVVLSAALYALIDQIITVEQGNGSYAGSYFQGMLGSDSFANVVRVLILSAALLTVLLTQLTGIPDAQDSADFHALLLGGTLGMLLMASANHLLMVFIAVEMASLPSYALAGFLKGKRTGSEAALKYVIYGAGASGVMLYGITLLSGTFGTGYLPNIAEAISRRGLDLPVFAGFGLLFVGLGFKLAAVPFHFWCPDVFEGAAAEVAGFLSVASKSAAVALTARILLTLQAHYQIFHPSGWELIGSLGLGVGIIAAITTTFGNLAAFGQTNLKRLLAYSTIAHAGYMLLAVSTITAAGIAGVLYYLAAYIAMNLGAFAVVALVRNATRSEDISAYRGLIQRSPVLAVTMTIFLLALLGLPPLAGFAGKWQVFNAVYDAGKVATASGQANLGIAFYILIGVGAVNTALSAYYYLRVVRVMLLESPDGQAIPGDTANRQAAELKVGPFASLYLIVLTIALFAAGINWDPLTVAADRAAGTFGLKR